MSNVTANKIIRIWNRLV